MSPRVEWCQCEHVDHDESPFMCTCPHTQSGTRFASRQCPVHNGDQHPYGQQNRTAHPQATAFGTFHLCLPCRESGHMKALA